MVFYCFFPKEEYISRNSKLFRKLLKYFYMALLINSANFNAVVIYLGPVLAMLLVSLICFAIMQARSLRKKVRQMLEKGFDIEKNVSTQKIFVYCHYRWSSQTIGKAEQQSCAPHFINEFGMEIEILTGIEHELLVSGFSPDSDIPDCAFRLAVCEVKLKQNPHGEISSPTTLQICFKPANNADELWSVAKVEDSGLTLEHQIMGRLWLPKPFKKEFAIGQQVKLISKTTKVGEAYRLTYEFTD